MIADWTQERRVTSDEGDFDLVISMGGNGDWYVGVCEVGKHPWDAVRIRTSGGHAVTHPGLGVALSKVYIALAKHPE